MLGSLRFRLPALFLLGVVLAGIVATVISIRFFQSYTRTRAIVELRSESIGIVQLYATQAGAEEVPLKTLEKAIGGDRIFYVPLVPGASLFSGPLPTLPFGTLTKKQLESGAADDAEPPCREERAEADAGHVPRRRGAADDREAGARRARRRQADVAAAQPLARAHRAARDRVRRRRPRRRPARHLSLAADRAAAAPALGGGGRDRRRHVRRRGAAAARQRRDRAAVGALRRHGREARRVGAAVAELPHVRLARAAHAVDRDPRARLRAPRGRDRGPGRVQLVARGHRGGGDAPRAARRRRARPREARRAPVHRARGGGRHARAVRARVRGLRRGGAPALDRLPRRVPGAAR